MSHQLVRKILSWLPSNLRSQLWRRTLILPPDNQLKITPAQSPEDFAAAFKILNDCYAEHSTQDSQSSPFYLTPYHLLPTTHVLLAKINHDIVGTVTIVADGAFGLPLEKICDLTLLKRISPRLGEATSLAIKKEFREKNDHWLWPISKGLYHYCTDHLGLDLLAITLKNRDRERYEGLLGFRPLDAKMANDENSESNPLWIGAYLDFRALNVFLEQNYKEAPLKRNLRDYFQSPTNINFDDYKNIYRITDRSLLPVNIIKEYFSDSQQVIQNLKQKELHYLCELYTQSAQTNELLKKYITSEPNRPARKNRRFNMNCQGRLLLTENHGIRISVKDISENGIQIWVPRHKDWEHIEGTIDDKCVLEFQPKERSQDIVKIMVSISRINSWTRIIGCRLLNQDENWQELVEFLKNYDSDKTSAAKKAS